MVRSPSRKEASTRARVRTGWGGEVGVRRMSIAPIATTTLAAAAQRSGARIRRGRRCAIDRRSRTSSAHIAQPSMCDLIHSCLAFNAMKRPERMGDVQAELERIAERLGEGSGSHKLLEW